MRIVIPVAVLAAAGIFLLVFMGDDTGERRTPSTSNGGPVDGGNGGGTHGGGGEALPDVEYLARTRARNPTTVTEFDRFVTLCAARGADAVPVILRLMNGEDVQLQPRWLVERGEPRGYPTLRSVYLKALAAIDAPEAADALRAVLDSTESAGESLIAARGLSSHGEPGWIEPLFRQANRAAVPVDAPVLKAMVELAVEQEPERAAVLIGRNAPRGEASDDPQVLALGLTLLPIETASRTARELLADEEVTSLAKSRYLRALIGRSGLEPLDRMREAALSDNWSRETRLETANSAAGSTAFFSDASAYQSNLAAGRTREADAARARFEDRMRATRALIEAALNIPDLQTSDHPRAESLRRRLEGQEKLLGKR